MTMFDLSVSFLRHPGHCHKTLAQYVLAWIWEAQLSHAMGPMLQPRMLKEFYLLLSCIFWVM